MLMIVLLLTIYDNVSFLIGISCVCVVILQKGTYDAENRIVTLQSELVGNASKVFCNSQLHNHLLVSK